MHDHHEILALAAAAIDFELDAIERQKLREGLDECPLCRRQAAAMRATATVLGRPPDIGTPRRVRDVVIGAAVRAERRWPPLRSLLFATLSVLALLGGTVFVAGNRGFLLFTPAPSASIPLQTAVVPTSTSASPTPAPLAPSPSTTPIPLGTEPPASVPALDDGPLRAGEIAAMVTNGRLVIRTKPGTGADSAIFKSRLYPGQRVLALEGPVEASGYQWYRVRLGKIEGWVAIAGLDGEPWLAPVRNGVIAFVGINSDGDNEAIYVVGSDGGSDESILFADPGLIAYKQLTWSPDGSRLAFVATPAAGNGTSEVYTISADGSDPVQITQNEVDDDSPAWSPDGSKLAVRVDEVDPNAPGTTSIVVVTAAGPGVTVLGPGANPVWSPDGAQVAMTVADGGTTRIWVQQADGSGRRPAADVAVASVTPSWSADGQNLVVSSSGLSIIELESGGLAPLTTEPASAPTWSIGGTIAFATIGSASPGIFVIDADGDGLRRVAGDPGVASSLAWAPDGRLLLLGDGGSGSPLRIVDPVSGTTSVVGAQDRRGGSPAWQPSVGGP